MWWSFGRSFTEGGDHVDYVISFADVMTAVISLSIGFLGWYIKKQYEERRKRDNELQNQIREGNEEIQKRIEKNDQKVNERIDKLEEKTDGDIQRIKQEINDIKGDFATTFVLREDFFRSMNGVEDKIKGIDGKIDRLLMMNKTNE